MLKSLKIENFRCFQHFELQQLGRVNLLVGMNNSGKTSILEAIQLLCSASRREALREILINRGEYIWSDEQRDQEELDVRHLFYGHRIEPGNSLSITGENDGNNESLTMNIRLGREAGFKDEQELALSIIWIKKEDVGTAIHTLLSNNKGLAIRTLKTPSEFMDSRCNTQFVTSASITTKSMIDLFDKVVLTPEESLVTEALQTIDPNIERIASLGASRYRYPASRNGFVVRLANSDQRVPIGSMGDGIWRMLGLTLAIVNAKNGVLLVDEIDTGLHFSAMSDMWRLIWETSRRLNVQVFATTHNSDCWTSLAEVAGSNFAKEDGITIHRIERNKTSSVVFNQNQIVIAAERGIEVR